MKFQVSRWAFQLDMIATKISAAAYASARRSGYNAAEATRIAQDARRDLFDIFYWK